MPLTILRRKIKVPLIITSLYLIFWSVSVIIFPTRFEPVLASYLKDADSFWDLTCFITFIFGVGIFIAAFNIFKYWPIVLMAAAYNLFIIGWYCSGFNQGIFNRHFAEYIVLNHVIWLFPQIYALLSVYRSGFVVDKLLLDSFEDEEFPLELFETTDRTNLADLSADNKVLLVFLRQFGCAFCKEMMMTIAGQKGEFETNGIRIVIVYMVHEKIAAPFLHIYGLDNITQISDPEEILYKRFQLHRGRFTQLFGLKVWRRWFYLAIKKKIVSSRVVGDYSQMPGIFLLKNGQVTAKFVHRSIADVPDYNSFLRGDH